MAQSPTVRVHLHLKSYIRDSYGSYLTTGKVALDVAASETVGSLKVKALLSLGEFDEVRNLEPGHHSKCQFSVGPIILTEADDGKTLAAAGVAEGAEVHVMLPYGHDSALCKP